MPKKIEDIKITITISGEKWFETRVRNMSEEKLETITDAIDGVINPKVITDQYQCQSYFENGKVINCTCGKCF